MSGVVAGKVAVGVAAGAAAAYVAYQQFSIYAEKCEADAERKVRGEGGKGRDIPELFPHATRAGLLGVRSEIAHPAPRGVAASPDFPSPLHTSQSTGSFQLPF